MKKILVLHGWEANPESNWFVWLKQQCNKNYEVYIPELSNTDYPILEEQVRDIQDIQIGPWDIIIGHSLGCQLALHIIESRNLTWVQAIFVAPTYPNLTDELGEVLFGDAFECLFNDYNTVNNFRNINKWDNNYTIFLSGDDPYINMFTAKKYYESLENITMVDFQGKGHFNTSALISELPEILEYI